MSELADLLPGFLVAAALLLFVGERAAAVRRRRAINGALHELRRPLQAIVLWAEAGAPAGPVIAGTVGMVSSALADVDRCVNGSAQPSAAPEAPVGMRAVVTGCVERWRFRAAREGANLACRWEAGGAVVLGRPERLTAALDNLVLNAIELGGPEGEVRARLRGGRLVIEVQDEGGRARRAARSPKVVDLITGRQLHGHGLRVVRGIVERAGGEFALTIGPTGAIATVELPLHPAGREVGGVAEALR